MTAAPAVYATDVLVIGWGLAGLVAASEAVAAGKRVVIVDQEPRTNLGGQAWWSFGGVFFVDSPEQRRMGIKDSLELARQDWYGNAGVRPRRGRVAASGGPRPTCSSPPARSARGCARSMWASSPSSAGPSAAATPPSDRATPCRASTSRGAPARAWWRRSRRSSSAPSSRGASRSCPGTGSRACATPPGRSSAPPATSSPPPAPRAGCRPRGRSSARSRSPRDRPSSPPAASGATTTWCAPSGPPASARRPRRCSPGVPAYVDGSMVADRRSRAARAW